MAQSPIITTVGPREESSAIVGKHHSALGMSGGEESLGIPVGRGGAGHVPLASGV